MLEASASALKYVRNQGYHRAYEALRDRLVDSLSALSMMATGCHKLGCRIQIRSPVLRRMPKVERKLGEVMNRHGSRRARYRGQPKLMMQQLMACTATNVKRFLRLICAPTEEVSLQA
jgi:hypothetical protein